jgi:hypothetical protein
MGSYIRAAQQHICHIATRVATSECADVRFALVSYRDHPPQDSTYVTRVFPFTAELEEMQQYVATMEAAGGGDGPEAVTAALDDAYKLPWRPNATKIAVLIADAPPHGLEPTGDGFPNGDPEGRDPLAIARQMAAAGITVYAVGCEPALGGYRFARDFMCSLAEITGGQAVALSCAERLADVIINGSAEEISLTRLTREVEQEVERVRAMGHFAAADEEEIQMFACKNLQSRGMKSKQMRHDGAMKQMNASVWKGASSLAAAKMELCKSAPESDMEDDVMPASEELRSAASFSRGKKSKSKKGFMSSMMPSFVRASAEPESASVPSAPMRVRAAAPAMMSARSMSARSMSARAASRSEPMDMPLAPEATSVKSNVLVEDEISYDQVKRIMAKKSAK